MNHQQETTETSSLRHSATSSLERLLWTVAETKECFQKYRMWPSFIGLSLDQEKKGSKGKLPVMLWDEQHRYLAEMVAAASHTSSSSSSSSSTSVINDSTASITPSRKRKLSEVDEVAGDDETEQLTPAKKKSRNTFFSALTNGFQSFTTRVSTVLAGAAQWMFSMGSGKTMDWSVGSSSSNKTPSTGRSVGKKTQGGLKTKRDGDVQMTVFRSLQHREYFVGPGDVYGGDYTIYRGGDPSNAHSTATVRVVRQRTIAARDLISFSRVQNQVAKSAVLAYLDPQTKEAKFVVVNFQSVSDRA